MSKRLWGLEWPTWTHDGIVCEPAGLEEVRSFIADHYPSIFALEAGPFLTEAMTDAKRRFLEECDISVLRDGAELAGIAIGHPTDWSTWYSRSFALLPKYRERSLLTEFTRRTSSLLAEQGIDRAEVDTSPANVPVQRALLQAGFLITSTTLSERWGTMLRFTRFFNPKAEEAFRRQYISVPNYGRSAQSKEGGSP
ncbi:MAG: hypothetical protein KIT84_27385 [Labilithrix sp.]|nr:hypothetical protein [Labilithrix sp.]MCW5814781.1 hypothetical protein [Labilithrix sp.]